jgi:hypothetical protein
MGEARGGVGCGEGDEGHLFIAPLTVAKSVARMSVLMSSGFADVFNTQMLSLTRMVDP